jgi:hypothetical protein
VEILTPVTLHAPTPPEEEVVPNPAILRLFKFSIFTLSKIKELQLNTEQPTQNDP